LVKRKECMSITVDFQPSIGIKGKKRGKFTNIEFCELRNEEKEIIPI
jgi:hypothetical protein